MTGVKGMVSLGPVENDIQAADRFEDDFRSSSFSRNYDVQMGGFAVNAGVLSGTQTSAVAENLLTLKSARIVTPRQSVSIQAKANLLGSLTGTVQAYLYWYVQANHWTRVGFDFVTGGMGTALASDNFGAVTNHVTGSSGTTFAANTAYWIRYSVSRAIGGGHNVEAAAYASDPSLGLAIPLSWVFGTAPIAHLGNLPGLSLYVDTLTKLSLSDLKVWVS